VYLLGGWLSLGGGVHYELLEDVELYELAQRSHLTRYQLEKLVVELAERWRISIEGLNEQIRKSEARLDDLYIVMNRVRQEFDRMDELIN
jgi:hypothetical protein